MKFFITRKFGKYDYHVSILLLYGCAFLLLGFALLGLAKNDWSLESKLYIVCNYERGCENNFYGSASCNELKYTNTPLCTREFFAFGESYGTPPSYFVTNANSFAFWILVAFLTINTLFFNRHLFTEFKNIEVVDDEKRND